MCAVDNSALVPFLKTCRPFDSSKPAHNCFFSELYVCGLNCSDSEGGILFLMPARQSDRRASILIYHLQWRLEFSGSGSNDCFRVESLWSTNDGNSSFDNSGFFASNLNERISQPFLMIKINRSNDRNIRLDCIGRIESAAKPRLKNDKIDFRRRKVL